MAHVMWLAGALVAGVVSVGTAAAQSDGERPSKEDFADEVAALVENELINWVRDPVVISAIRDANVINAGMTPERIEALDQEWRRQTKSAEKYMIWDLLDRQGSIILRDRREQSDGIVTEIIVMDKWGLNAAISDPTSDFNQGDEAKYLETYPKGVGAVHVSELEFDESTQKVQTQVSMPVTDPEDGDKVIGAVTFGIDLSALK
jgi:hypothetical protein